MLYFAYFSKDGFLIVFLNGIDVEDDNAADDDGTTTDSLDDNWAIFVRVWLIGKFWWVMLL